MALFYTTKFEGIIAQPQGKSFPAKAYLPENESLHCAKVLRLKEGAFVEVTDGEGGMYRGALQEVNAKACVVGIEEVLKGCSPPLPIHIALAPTKQIERVEWFIEKAVEVGVQRISLFQTQRTERNRIPEERLEKIIVSAMKQSMQSYKPILSPFGAWEDFLCAPWSKGAQGIKMMAYCGKEYPRKELANELKIRAEELKNGLHLLIGPEGDFTPQEVQQAIEQQYEPVVLGPHRLRTETAALYACVAGNCASL